MSQKSEWRIELEKQGLCKRDILKAYSKEYRKRNADRLDTYVHSDKVKNRQINRHMQSRYGLERSQYDKMIEAQHNQCKICGVIFGDRDTIHIDHSHTTGKVRGLLCANCNKALGNVKDNTDILQSMINYLSNTQG